MERTALQAVMLTIFLLGVMTISLKLAAGVATGMKQELATFHEEDPIVNLRAWFDRVTTLHRP
jgi:hypothetical protein